MITKNLSYKEATFSATAHRLGIKNEPTKEHLINLCHTGIKIFQPLRDWLGKPINVKSMYRGAALNARIKGASKTSQHLEGKAIDIDVDGRGYQETNAELFYWAVENLDFDQIIFEFGNADNPEWVHISYDKDKKEQRKKITIAYKKEKTYYKSFYDLEHFEIFKNYIYS